MNAGTPHRSARSDAARARPRRPRLGRPSAPRARSPRRCSSPAGRPRASCTWRVGMRRRSSSCPSRPGPIRGRWHLLRRNAGAVTAFGLVAVAGCQFAYFNAVETLSIAVALLLEYLGSVLVVGWMWAAPRPPAQPRLTLAGVVLSVLGLVLVLDVFSGVADLVGGCRLGPARRRRPRHLLRVVEPRPRGVAAAAGPRRVRARRRRGGARRRQRHRPHRLRHGPRERADRRPHAPPGGCRSPSWPSSPRRSPTPSGSWAPASSARRSRASSGSPRCSSPSLVAWLLLDELPGLDPARRRAAHPRRGRRGPARRGAGRGRHRPAQPVRAGTVPDDGRRRRARRWADGIPAGR